MERKKLAVAVAVVVVLAVFGIRYAISGRQPAAPADRASAPIVAWCAAGLEAIPGEGCFAAPRDARAPVPLVVYLHGRYARTAADEELDRQARLAQRATARGYAVLALRGRLGLCGGKLEDWYCWPSNEKTAPAAPEIAGAWEPALATAEARAGRGRRYLLGFSNGGYFATLLAARDLFRADAVAIAGAGSATTIHPAGPKPPIVLLFAEDDAALESMQGLASELRAVDWPFAAHVRDGGHQLTDGDIDAALTFFSRTQKERLPLEPPFSNRTPKARAPAARAGAAAASAAAAGLELEAGPPEPPASTDGDE